MVRIGRLLLLLGSATIVTSGQARGVEPVKPQDFERLHALIKPQTKEEKWLQIPWMISLWEARQRAATEGKPILLWEMDGHPLGCT